MSIVVVMKRVMLSMGRYASLSVLSRFMACIRDDSNSAM